MKTSAALALLLIALLPHGTPDTPPSGNGTTCVGDQPATAPYPTWPNYVESGGDQSGARYVRVYHSDRISWTVVTVPCDVMTLVLRCAAEAPTGQVYPPCQSFHAAFVGLAYDGSAQVVWTSPAGATGQAAACEMVVATYGFNPLWACTGSHG